MEQPAPPPTTCTVCAAASPKYKCPRCLRRTCSVACVRAHKSRDSCSGERSKTDYVPLQSYTETHLYSDYALLEDAARTADVAARSRHSGPLARAARPNTFKLAPRHRHLLAGAGKRRVPLRFMSRGMSRAEANASRFDARSGEMFWSVELVLPAVGVSVVLDPVIDTTTVAGCLDPLLAAHSPVALRHPAAHRAALGLLGEADRAELYYYWKRPVPQRGDDPKRVYLPVSFEAPLADTLIGCPVLEFPTLVVTTEPLAPNLLVVPRADADPEAEMDLDAAEEEPPSAVASAGDDGEEGEIADLAASDDDDSSSSSVGTSAASSPAPSSPPTRPTSAASTAALPPKPTSAAPTPTAAPAHASLPARPAWPAVPSTSAQQRLPSTAEVVSMWQSLAPAAHARVHSALNADFNKDGAH
ncbi:Box C/D snoRNA accumulation [Blastocladiella emersonii ATCC 22665]|nr:Box C/D snoRNA accumulation [Blastocladiella emersonii ATCC 22665]